MNFDFEISRFDCICISKHIILFPSLGFEQVHGLGKLYSVGIECWPNIETTLM